MSIEAMKLALDALETLDSGDTYKTHNAATALRQAIEQAQQVEPVAMQMDVIVVNLVREGINKHRARELAEHFIKHTSPPPRQPLTDEQIEKLAEQVGMCIDKYGLAFDAQNGLEDGVDAFGFARAIEAAHGIKENT